MTIKGKMNGLSLFTGYAGIDLALNEWVKPVLYCEIEPYPQAILLSRMDEGSIPFAPIWNDVTTIDGSILKGLVDIVYGGFPCQDISSAGKGAGLEGERSGLFYEVIRICKEASPLFVFLENVAAIRTRGSIEIQEELASIGYDCRFGMLSAAEVGANHKRDRWFCLGIKREMANALCDGQPTTEKRLSTSKSYDRDSTRKNGRSITKGRPENIRRTNTEPDRNVSDPECIRTQVPTIGKFTAIKLPRSDGQTGKTSAAWWGTEPDVGRVANGITNRMDRIKACGNGVVPLQVKAAFEILMGMSQ